MTLTLRSLQQCRDEGRRFSVLTAYDACLATLESEAGIDVILVGDSLGMVVQGRESTVPVTVEQMAYHTACVRRGNHGSLIMADMPFMTGATTERALEAATELMQAGANLVKLEGGGWLAETVSVLQRNGIPVCAHLGLTPQAVNTLGGYRVQGRETGQAEQMIDDARRLQDAGAELLLLECVPREVTARLVEEVAIPVIGIGAGPECHGQVLVAQDMLGMTVGKSPRFVKDFLADAVDIPSALRRYDEAVKAGTFPAEEHCFRLSK